MLNRCYSKCLQLLAVAIVWIINGGAMAQEQGVEFSKLPTRRSLAEGETLFRERSATETGVRFQMELPSMIEHVHELLHLSVMGGICAGDVNGDGLPDFYVTSPAGGNRLFLNRGSFRFDDVTARSGLLDTSFWGTGAVMVDIDGDADLDIYACGYRSPNQLWINEGKGTNGEVHFRDAAEKFGLAFNGASMSAAFADYDHDGDLDMYLATTAVPPPPDLKFQVRFEGNRPLIPDELREYWALVYLPGERAHRTEAGQFDHLFRNDGGKFVDVSKAAGIDGPYFTLGAIWWDCNGDGWPDLYVANDYLGPDMLYLNQRDGTFKDVIRERISHTPWSSMGVDVGDLNNDGRFDLIATDMLGTTHFRRHVMLGEVSRTDWYLEVAEPRQYPRNAVYLNSGTDRFQEAAYLTGMVASDWTWAPRIEDFDEDGRVDVFFANGMLRDVQHADLGNYADRMLGGGSPEWAKFWAELDWHSERNLAFRNLGELRFENVSKAWGLDRLGVSFGTATADFDNDGDLDLVTSNADAPISILENRSASSNRLRVKLRGRAGNTFGVGATVRLKANGMEQTRYLTTTRGWLGGGEPVLHFGLGDATKVDSLVIDWPDGRRQELANLDANQTLVISEPASAKAGMESAQPSWFEASAILSGVADTASTFDDSVAQPLLPYRISRTRFCMAWGDVDGDGDEDLFIGGGVGEAGRLFIQGKNGAFAPTRVADFDKALLNADAAAVFFDADGDHDLDLYVASGGVEAPAGNEVLFQDRLYLNDGKGGFAQAPEGSLPTEAASGRCVAVGDLNGDGKPDLFVGGGSTPGDYPNAERSYLFVNEGGRFVDRTPAALQRPGLVTDATWADLNGDGADDLAIAVELGSVKAFFNRGGELAAATAESGLAARTGWWRSLAAADFDRDGDIDLVAGNIGLNTRYSEPRHLPQLVYQGRFGTNDAVRFIEAYHEDGQIYPHRGFDELSRAFRELRDKFLNFDEFSSTNLAGMFPQERLAAASRLEMNTAASGVWVNDGKGHFEFRLLPAQAQLSPINDIEFADVDGDGVLDLVVAQNDFSPDRLTGRFDGGLSLVLLGDGSGNFNAVYAGRSGVVIPTEARAVRLTDLNGDGRPDLVFGGPGERLRVLTRR